MLREYIQRQMPWSARTFGPGPRTLGIIEHIRKELSEIEDNPKDLMEWIDVVILALDGAWRAGWTPKQIVNALRDKQRQNFMRKWPPLGPLGPQDKANEHIRDIGA